MSRVLLGSITSYYAWRGAVPYLNFAITDYASIPLTAWQTLEFTVALTKANNGLWAIITKDTTDTGSNQSSSVVINVARTAISGGFCKFSDGSNVYPSFCSYTLGSTINVKLVYDNTAHTISVYKDGAFVTTVTDIRQPYINRLFDANNVGSLSYLSVNGTKYIQQGDQNGSSILPSTPAGQNGTISGAGWKYVGISGHYETVALLNSYISSTTLTEPLEVMLIDPLDTSTVPTSKDGFPITIFNGTNYRNYDFSFSTRW